MQPTTQLLGLQEALKKQADAVDKLALPATLGTGMLAQSLYVKNLAKMVASDPEVANRLLEAAKRSQLIEGVGKMGDDVAQKVGPAFFTNLEDWSTAMIDDMKKHPFKYIGVPSDKEKLLRSLRAGYGINPTDAVNKIVVLNSKVADKPGVIAHEIGHALDAAQGTNLGTKLRQFSRKGTALAFLAPTLAAAFGGDEKTVGAIGGASALATLPTLRDEFVASKNGYKLLRNLGQGKLRSLGAFSGVPSYASAAALAFAPLAVTSWLKKRNMKKLIDAKKLKQAIDASKLKFSL